MPTFTFTSPDGKSYDIDGPEGATQQQAFQMLQQHLSNAGQDRPTEQTQSVKSSDSVIANLGAGALRGAGSIGATILSPIDAAARAMGVQNDLIGRTDRREAMDEALQSLGANPDTLAYKGGKIGAEIAGTAGIGGILGGAAKGIGAAPSLVKALQTSGLSTNGATGIPSIAARAVGGGLTGGVSTGLINPEDAKTGAIIGSAIPLGATAAGLAGRGVGRVIAPNQATSNAANLADKYGIPYGLADVSDSKAVQATQSILKDLPFVGSMSAKTQEAKQEAFNKAVGSQFGAPETKLTLDVLDSAKQRMGDEFNRIWGRNSLNVDQTTMQRITDLYNRSRKMPESEGASVRREVGDLLGRATQDANGNVTIPGDTANSFQQYLRRRSEGNTELSRELGDLRVEIIGAFNRSINPNDAAALTLNRTQYKAFKTVEPLLRSTELGVAGREAGNIPAALLPNAVNKSYGNLQNVPLADLSKVGSRLLVDRTPQTGGSTRALIQNGLALGGIGHFLGIPAAAITAGTAYGTQKALQSPALARMALGQKQLPNQALINALRAGQLAAPAINAQ